MKSGTRALLHILAVDGLRSVVGLARVDPQLIGALGTCVREGLVTVVRPRLKPTGYSRLDIPTDIVALTHAGRREAERNLGCPAPAVSLIHEIEHRVGVGELRSTFRIPPEAWTSAAELHIVHLTEPSSIARRGLPDGLADIDGMRLAFEYDHGRYTAAQVRLKQQTFSRLADSAVWAAPTARRAEWLRQLGCVHVVATPLPLGAWNAQSREPHPDLSTSTRHWRLIRMLTFEQPSHYAAGGGCV